MYYYLTTKIILLCLDNGLDGIEEMYEMSNYLNNMAKKRVKQVEESITMKHPRTIKLQRWITKINI